MLGSGATLGLLIVSTRSAGLSLKPVGQGAWGDLADAVRAGLCASTGVVLGRLEGELLCFNGPEHHLLIGASRSGKGRGQIVPTLLAWPHSALVLDIKGELADGDARVGFPGTARFRAQLGPVLRFAPTKARSCAFNPLFEVRRGPNEVRDVMNLVEVIVDPAGDGRHNDFWDRMARAIICGVTLHVLYTEPDHRKSLAVVRERLRDLDATAETMKATLHRRNLSTGEPETHPEILHAAESYLAGEVRMRSGIKATAESYFGVFADEMVAANTSRSDFRIGDLMCADHPVTLYLQPPASDVTRLTPLLRLMINQFARALMEDQGHDGRGLPKRHRLLLVLDEFPVLGRMPFFEIMMGAMAGFGLKALLVCQSLNHITRAYTRANVIIDNSHVVTLFAAADNETAQRVADMVGEVREVRQSLSRQRPRPILGFGRGQVVEREEKLARLMPGEVRELPRDKQIILVSGVKPFMADKIAYDQEPQFKARLKDAKPRVWPGFEATHDWIGVRAIGVVAQAAKPQPILDAREHAKTGAASKSMNL
jgi:type IV secretion system protein VirD4